MKTPTEKSTKTRQLLLDTALELFATRGFAGTTMRVIAEESGLSLGNAYYYFESKDAIVHELFRDLLEKHRAATWPLYWSRETTLRQTCAWHSTKPWKRWLRSTSSDLRLSEQPLPGRTAISAMYTALSNSDCGVRWLPRADHCRHWPSVTTFPNCCG